MKKKILLGLLPFWDPQIPPLGLACIKSYLQHHGWQVKAVDANLEIQFRELYDQYYKILAEFVPNDHQGNLFNIGNQVLRNHLMIHFNASTTGKRDQKYRELVRVLVEKTFFTYINEGFIDALDNIISQFYPRLKSYVLEMLEREQPAVLGLSVYGDTFPASLAVFHWAKKWNPSIQTVMGGGIFADQLAPGSLNLDYFVQRTHTVIDKIIIGEGEVLMLEMLQGGLNPARKIYSLKDIQGKYMDLAGAVVPDFSDFHLGYYPHLAHYGARSCPFQCKFCSETINWGKYREKNVNQTVQELIRLQRRYSYQLFLLTDSSLNPIISELSRAFIEAGVTIYWDGFLRADRHACSTENTMLWRKGGFYRAKLGLESGSQRMLDLMNKRITTAQSRETLAALAYAGIKTTTFWLLGFPGETEQDFQETLDFIEACKDYIYEADCNAFNYYLTGQANSRDWQKNNRVVLLYPEWAKELLLSQTWILDCHPSREIAYQRLNRFIRHCQKLGIPNPYSLKDVFQADERWKNLHKNAVPAIMTLKNTDTYVDENRHVKTLAFAENKIKDEGNWF